MIIHHLGEDFFLGAGDHLILGEQKGGSVVTENQRGITENFGRIQRGDHLNLLGK